jgi:hypothetical protein
VLRWDAERRAKIRADCCMSFFDEYAEYAELVFVLEIFPAFKLDLERYEFARKRVLEIVARIEEVEIDSSLNK